MAIHKSKHIHVYVGGKTKDVSPENELAYQELMRAIKSCDALKEKLQNAANRAKADKGSMDAADAREVRAEITKIGYKVI